MALGNRKQRNRNDPVGDSPFVLTRSNLRAQLTTAFATSTRNVLILVQSLGRLQTHARHDISIMMKQSAAANFELSYHMTRMQQRLYLNNHSFGDLLFLQNVSRRKSYPGEAADHTASSPVQEQKPADVEICFKHADLTQII